jgi:hypothetical protein
MARVAWNESAMQQSLFQWIDGVALDYPPLRLAFHPANGGQRHITTAERLKREGVRAGVPDVIIPLPIYDRDGEQMQYVGMAIELKVNKNKLSYLQANYLYQLTRHQWKVIVVRDFYEVAAWHICQAYHRTYLLADYAAVNQGKWAGVVNDWTPAQWNDNVKGGYDVR